MTQLTRHRRSEAYDKLSLDPAGTMFFRRPTANYQWTMLVHYRVEYFQCVSSRKERVWVRLLDERGRIFGKVNIVDLLTVLVLIAAGVWFAYAKFGRDLQTEMAAREQPIEYCIVVMGVRPTTADALKKGGKAFEFKTGAEIGTIKEVKVEPADVWTVSDKGTWIRTQTDDRVDAFVYLEATARVGENVITVNGVEIRVGTSIGFTTKWAQVNGNIMTMNLPGGGE